MVVNFRRIYCEGKQIGAVWQCGNYSKIQFAAGYFPEDRGEAGWLSYSRAHMAEYMPMMHLHPLLRRRFAHLTIGKVEQTPDLPETLEGLPEWAQHYKAHRCHPDGLQSQPDSIPSEPWHTHLFFHLRDMHRQLNQYGAVWFEATP